MRWVDENYVRVYTRDSLNWQLLGWEAQALFVLALRKADRLGMIELGSHGLRGLCVLLKMPRDVVERASQELLDSGAWEFCDGTLVVPNFLDAQSAPMSTRARSRLFRERKRAVSRVLEPRSHSVEEHKTGALACVITDDDRKKRSEPHSLDEDICLIESRIASNSGATASNESWPHSKGANSGATERNATQLSTLRYATLKNSLLAQGVRVALSCNPLPGAGMDAGCGEGGVQPPSMPPATQPRTADQVERQVPLPGSEARSKKTPKAPAGYREFHDAFTALFQRHRGVTPAWGAKQGRQVKQLLARGGLGEAVKRAERMFAIAPGWPAENPDLQTLLGHWDKFAPPVARSVTTGHALALPYDAYPEPGEDLDF